MAPSLFLDYAHTKRSSQNEESLTIQGFSKETCELVIGFYVFSINNMQVDQIPKKMILYVYVFCTCMLDMVLRYVDNTKIITDH